MKTNSIALACCIMAFALSSAVIIASIPSLITSGEPLLPMWVMCVLLGVAAGSGSAMFMLRRIMGGR